MLSLHAVLRVLTPVTGIGAAVSILGAALSPVLASPPPPPSGSAPVVVMHGSVAREMARYERDMRARKPRRPRRPAVTETAQAVPPVQSSPPVSSLPPNSGVLTEAQVGALWLEEGGPADEEMAAECISHYESGGNPDADNGAGDIGLFQVSVSWAPYDDLLNPAFNTREAISILEGADYVWSTDWTTAGDCGLA